MHRRGMHGRMVSTAYLLGLALLLATPRSNQHLAAAAGSNDGLRQARGLLLTEALAYGLAVWLIGVIALPFAERAGGSQVCSRDRGCDLAAHDGCAPLAKRQRVRSAAQVRPAGYRGDDDAEPQTLIIGACSHLSAGRDACNHGRASGLADAMTRWLPRLDGSRERPASPRLQSHQPICAPHCCWTADALRAGSGPHRPCRLLTDPSARPGLPLHILNDEDAIVANAQIDLPVMQRDQGNRCPMGDHRRLGISSRRIP